MTVFDKRYAFTFVMYCTVPVHRLPRESLETVAVTVHRQLARSDWLWFLPLCSIPKRSLSEFPMCI